MPQDPRTLQVAVMRAEDLDDLLTHIAWTDTLEPEFTKIQKMYSDLLVKSVLGNKAAISTPLGPQELSSEQLAARIDSIEWLRRKILEVLKNGHRASEQLTANNS